MPRAHHSSIRYGRFRYLLFADLYRLDGRVGWLEALYWYCRGEVFRFNVWFRLCAWTRGSPIMRYTLCPLARWVLARLKFRLGISIPPDTDIGPGFYIGHFGGIVVNGQCVIGRNCNISHGVTLGSANRGPRKGCPVIGDNVYLGPGSKIIGSVRVGDNAAVGANCVVTRDVPENAVVGGAPARVLSWKGSADYVERIDYDRLLTAPEDGHADRRRA